MENVLARFGLSGEPGTEDFWAAAHSPVSVPSGDGWTTLFLWRGTEANLVFENWPAPFPLARWADTDCWYTEVDLPAHLRVTYHYTTDDGKHPDPLNPVGAGGVLSIAAVPDAPEQPHWPSLTGGTTPALPETGFPWAAERLGGPRTVHVHPVGGGGPVVLLLDGDDWLHLHPAMAAFDSAAAQGEMPPATLVFLPSGDRLAEFTCNPALWEAVRDELLPLVAASGVPADVDRLIVAGQSLGGLSALYAALEFPGLVSGVACQSGSFWWTPDAMKSASPLDGPVGGTTADRLRERPDLSGLRVAFDVGELEAPMLPHCGLIESLIEPTGATVRVSRTVAGHDRVGWRHALLRDVAWLLS